MDLMPYLNLLPPVYPQQQGQEGLGGKITAGAKVGMGGVLFCPFSGFYLFWNHIRKSGPEELNQCHSTCQAGSLHWLLPTAAHKDLEE